MSRLNIPEFSSETSISGLIALRGNYVNLLYNREITILRRVIEINEEYEKGKTSADSYRDSDTVAWKKESIHARFSYRSLYTTCRDIDKELGKRGYPVHRLPSIGDYVAGQALISEADRAYDFYKQKEWTMDVFKNVLPFPEKS